MSNSSVPIWRHKGRGGLYMPFGLLRMKHPVTRAWEDAVLYRAKRGKRFYVRLKSDWDEKFEQVSGPVSESSTAV